MKAILYNQLKLAKEMGAPFDFDKPYVNYTVDELQQLMDVWLPDAGPFGEELPEPREADDSGPRAGGPGRSDPVAPQPQRPAPATDKLERVAELQAQQLNPSQMAEALGIPLEDRSAERAGLTFNSHGPDDPLRVDSRNFVWYQDEVIKPAIPKPRARRVVQYKDPGVKEIRKNYADGRLDESFEVAGDEAVDMQIRITLPSWQVGIYKDRRLPFRVHTYNGLRAFSWRDIVIHYGGMDLVPSAIKRVYVGNDLCFDIKSTRDQMESEYATLQLQAGRSF